MTLDRAATPLQSQTMEREGWDDIKKSSLPVTGTLPAQVELLNRIENQPLPIVPADQIARPAFHENHPTVPNPNVHLPPGVPPKGFVGKKG